MRRTSPVLRRKLSRPGLGWAGRRFASLLRPVSHLGDVPVWFLDQAAVGSDAPGSCPGIRGMHGRCCRLLATWTCLAASLARDIPAAGRDGPTRGASAMWGGRCGRDRSVSVGAPSHEVTIGAITT